MTYAEHYMTSNEYVTLTQPTDTVTLSNICVSESVQINCAIFAVSLALPPVET